MTNIKNLSPFVIGLAMFSMFFGSGNLIFPLFVGQDSAGQWLSAYGGFFITAVLMPFLGVIAMAVFKGDYQSFFGILGKTGGFLMTILLLTIWIPLGSGPRGITLAHASLASQTSWAPPFWLYSAIYCVIITIIVSRRNRMLEVLGKYLTPLLLGCIGWIVFEGIKTAFSNPAPLQIQASGSSFLTGVAEGYNTMDLIASFFFSASIIDILRRGSHDKKGSINKALKSGMIGVAILGGVYFFMIWIGAIFSDQLVDVRKDQLLVYIASHVLGGSLGFVAAMAVMLACMTTSIALLKVYTDFLAEYIFMDRKKEWICILITQVASFVMSLTGLEGVTKVTNPVFQVCYPVLFILIIVNIGRKCIARRNDTLVLQQ